MLRKILFLIITLYTVIVQANAMTKNEIYNEIKQSGYTIYEIDENYVVVKKDEKKGLFYLTQKSLNDYNYSMIAALGQYDSYLWLYENMFMRKNDALGAFWEDKVAAEPQYDSMRRDGDYLIGLKGQSYDFYYKTKKIYPEKCRTWDKEGSNTFILTKDGKKYLLENDLVTEIAQEKIVQTSKKSTKTSEKYDSKEHIGAYIVVKKNGKFGALYNDIEILSPIYDNIKVEGNMLSYVKDKKWGLMYNDSKLLENYPAEQMQIYGEYVIVSKKNNKYGIINYDINAPHAISGFNYEYDNIERISYRPDKNDREHIYYKTTKNKKYGAYDEYGRLVAVPAYDNISLSVENKSGNYNSQIFVVTKNNKKGALRKQDYIYISAVPTMFDDVELIFFNLTTYYILVTQNNKKGIYISANEIPTPSILPPVFDEIKVQSPYIIAKQYGKWGVYLLGQQTVPIKYDKIEIIGHYVIVTLNNQQGVYYNGNIIVPIGYDEVQLAENSVYSACQKGARFIIKKHNKYGVYNLFPAEYDNIEQITRGYIVEQNKKYGLYHITKGKILDPVYDKLYMKDGSTLVSEKNGQVVKTINMADKSIKEKTDDALFNIMFFPILLPMKGLH